MALLTISSPIEKETAITFTLSKEDLFDLTSVGLDPHWSVEANITRVILHYLSTEGSQTKILTFNVSSETPTATTVFSSSARDAFNLHLVTLMDHDGGTLLIGRGDEDLSLFDISF